MESMTLFKRTASHVDSGEGRLGAQERLLALVAAMQRRHPGMTQADAERIVRATAEGAALWREWHDAEQLEAEREETTKRVSISKHAPATLPDPNALTKGSHALAQLTALAGRIGWTEVLKTAEGQRLAADYCAADAHLTALGLAQSARADLQKIRRDAARRSAGQPVTFAEAVDLVQKRDAVAYPVAAARAATEFGDLYRGWQQQR